MRWRVGRSGGPASGGPWVPLGQGLGQMCVKVRGNLGEGYEGVRVFVGRQGWVEKWGAGPGGQNPGVYVCST